MGLVMRVVAVCACAVLALALPGSALAAPKGLYATNYVTSGTVSEFSFGSGGKLTANGSISSGDNSWNAAATPNGKYLYVGNYSGADLSKYDILANGSLKAMSTATVSTGTEPVGVAVTPNGKYVYVANYGGSTVSIFNVGSTGALTPNSNQATESSNLNGPYGLAISPDGKSLYATNYSSTTGASGVAEFNIAANGTLSAKSTATIGTGDAPTWVVLTPNGKHAYVTNLGTSSDTIATISQYSVGTGGELASIGSPVHAGSANDYLYQAAVSPNGRSLYAPNDTAIYQFNIGTTGLLKLKSTPYVTAPGGAEDLWLSASGKSAYDANYVTSGTGTISQFNVGSTGLLTSKSQPTVNAGDGTAAVVIPPDQGPVASFQATPAAAGKATRFSGSASHDSDGKVVGYAWSFGDGTSAHTGTAAATHAYKKAGKYTVTLTVTDDSGCSTAFVFTGTTAYCNGTLAARHQLKITIK